MMTKSAFSRWQFVISISALIVLAISIAYVYREQPIYVWDEAMYWNKFQQYGSLISSNPVKAILHVLGAIRDEDRNPTGVVPLYPFFALFGGGRASFISAIAVFYLLPSVILVTLVSEHVAETSRGLPLFAFIIASTFLPFWDPTLRGMVDISGLVFIGLATLLVFRTNFLISASLSNAALLGLILWMPFLLRRWYAYSIIVFLVATAAIGLAKVALERGTWSRAVRLIALLGVATGTLTALLLIFQYELVLRILSTSYGDLYSAYQAPMSRHLSMLAGRLGPYILILIAIGTVWTVGKRNVYGVFCLVAALGTFLFFTRTQILGRHHFLPIAFWLFPLMITGAKASSRILTVLPGRYRLAPFAAISAAVFLANITHAPSLGVVSAMFVPRADSSPLRLENFPAYESLANDLDRLVGPRGKFVVYASSGYISDELLIAINKDLRSKVISAPHIAKIGMFKFEALRADYAVAVTPAQTHQAPHAQDNITIPGQMILDHNGFGAAFEKVSTYRLAHGIRATLFKRTRTVTAEETSQLIDVLGRSYPSWPERFRSSMAIPFSTRTESIGDGPARVIVRNLNSILVHPGDSTATSVELPLDDKYSKMPRQLTLSIPKSAIRTCPTADGVTTTIRFAGEEWKIEVLPGMTNSIGLPAVAAGTLVIATDKKSQPLCDQEIATFTF